MTSGWKCQTLFCILSQTVLAPATIAQTTESAYERFELEEIVVTATKRPESVQDVPIAVSAYSGDSLAERGFFEVIELAQVSPSVTINPLGNNTQTIVRIRGVGTDGVNVGFESSVGVFVDGVFRARAGQALNNLLDIERIEVMRGPQGTLFGKNTSAGAISIVSKMPEYELGGSLAVSAGSFDLRRVTGVITGAVVEDKLAFRLAATSHKRDGILDKLGPGANPTTRVEHFYNDRDREMIKGQLLFEPTDDLSARIIVDYSNLDEVGNISMPLILGPVSELGFAGGLFGVPPGTPFSSMGLNELGAFEQPDRHLEDLQSQNNTDPFEDTEDIGFTGEINWSMGWGDLTSITAWRDYETIRANDLDLVGADILGPLPESTDISGFTQELRIAGTRASLDWLVGMYLFDEEIDFTSDISIGSQFSEFFGNGLPPGIFTGQGIRQTGTQSNSGFALFTQNTFHVKDSVEITAGLRYSDSEKRGISIINGAAPGTPSVSDPLCAALFFITAVCNNRSLDVKRSEDAVSGTINARYIWNEDVSAYASYAHGYKAGGVNLDRESMSDAGGVVVDVSQFAPEFVDSLELGLRSSIFDNRTIVNLTVFYSDFKDFQLNSFNGIAFTVISIDQAISKGVELDLTTLLTSNVQVDFSASYVDARFGADLGGGNLAVYEGVRLPESSRWQVGAAISGQAAIPGNSFRVVYNASYGYRSDARSGSLPAPEQRQGAYSLLNGSVGIRTQDDRFGLTVSGTNLTDKIVAPFISPTIFQPGSFSAYVNNPRMFSVTLDARF
jgi:outer membrane receptor protein involved in Fe transport